MATWVGYPRSYTPGRARPIQYVVIHTTEGSEGATSAEAGAAYDKRRTDGVSTHLFVDTDTALQEVPFGDRAHAARWHGNEIGVQVELCGTARQTAAQWHDAASTAMLRLAAVEVAAICRIYGLPPVRLTVPQVRAAYYAAPAGGRPKGICGHVDVTRAYPEDGGDHTDPGPNFPWTEFLAMVQAELEDDMATAQEIAAAVWATKLGSSGPTAAVALQDTYRVTKGMAASYGPKLDEILAAAQDDSNVEVVLKPEQIAALEALRADLKAEIRDAAADLGEGGAAQVRADEDA